MLKKSENVPLKWLLTRITEIHSCTDGIVRVVTVRTKKGIYKRAITNIAPLLE